MTVDPMETVRAAAPHDGQPVLMMPAEAYTSAGRAGLGATRNLFAGSWTCLGREDELFPDARSVTQRAVMVGDIPCLVVRARGRARDVRQHLPAPRPRAAARRGYVGAAQHPVPLPRLDLRLRWPPDRGQGLPRGPGVRLRGARPRRAAGAEWEGWVFGHALHPVGSAEVPSFGSHLGDARAGSSRRTRRAAGRRRPAHLRGRGELEDDLGELPRVLPLPADPPGAVPGEPAGLAATTTTCPGAWIGGSMELRDGVQTMSLDGSLAATRLPGVSPRITSSTSTCCPTC